MQRSSMAQNSKETIYEYRRLLAKDPMSKVFAPLAEALRENKQLAEAEKIAARGVQKHPRYVGGYVALGRVLMDQLKFDQALPILKEAKRLDPQNLLALQLLGTTLLQIKNPKEALKAFKMVLFLNPSSEKARKAVAKLETLSAEDYEEEIFQYQNLSAATVAAAAEKNAQLSSLKTEIKTETVTANEPSLISENEVERKLSLIDALILRNAFDRATAALQELNKRSPDHPEVLRRFQQLEEDLPEEEATPIQPLLSRERLISERKKRILENLLQRINRKSEELITNL
jgi:tetratricopeptide (TPR) repeat protein